MILEFPEAVRTRPAMYIGNVKMKGVVTLFKNVLSDCIRLTEGPGYNFQLTIHSNTMFTLEIESKKELHAFLHPQDSKDLVYTKVLEALSTSFETQELSPTKLKINFELDDTILNLDHFDYIMLMNEFLLFAMLNRETTILLKDQRTRHPQQNYFAFPEGVQYLFERHRAEVMCNDLKLELSFEGSIGTDHYQVYIGYRADWYPDPYIASFANNDHTTQGGSLVEGIFAGFRKGCKRYVKQNKLANYKIKKQKFLNGLILVATVRGHDFEYAGSSRECLGTERIEKNIKKKITELTLEYLTNNKEKAHDFLWRFDETQFGSSMFSMPYEEDSEEKIKQQLENLKNRTS